MAEVKFPTEVVDLPSKGLLYPKENPLSSGQVEVKDKILECFMYISVVGLGVTAAEKFGKK